MMCRNFVQTLGKKNLQMSVIKFSAMSLLTLRHQHLAIFSHKTFNNFFARYAPCFLAPVCVGESYRLRNQTIPAIFHISSTHL